jgi:hypothetical protein
MKESRKILLPNSMDEQKKSEHQKIQLKLSIIFKQKVIDTAQTFGSFYDPNGERYCAISALSRYFGYDIAAAVLKKTQNDKNTYSPELIPHGILEMIENFAIYNSHIRNLKCFCSKPDYYYRNSLISLLIHLNDYHEMTFRQIGDWLEKRGM